jgi:transposase-like protein
MRKYRSKEEWQRLLASQKESGQTIARFCNENGLSPGLFYRKKKELSQSGRFIKITPSGFRLESKPVTIRVGDFTIEVNHNCSSDLLKSVILSIKESGHAQV